MCSNGTVPRINDPMPLKKPRFYCFLAVLFALVCFLSGGGTTTGSSCTTLLFSSFRVATVSVRSGAGSPARKTNGASTVTCSSGRCLRKRIRRLGIWLSRLGFHWRRRNGFRHHGRRRYGTPTILLGMHRLTEIFPLLNNTAWSGFTWFVASPNVSETTMAEAFHGSDCTQVSPCGVTCTAT